MNGGAVELGDALGGGEGELVGLADDEVLEGEARVERRADVALGRRLGRGPGRGPSGGGARRPGAGDAGGGSAAVDARGADHQRDAADRAD